MGQTGLSALLDKGFCGPNYDLSDQSVMISEMGDSYNIEFWDMECSVQEGNKYYSKIRDYFESSNK